MSVLIDPSRFKTPPFKHQLEGVRAIVRHPAFYIGDKPRTGKSRQAVDAACVLVENNLIDTVVVLGPIAARGVWCDKQLGQIKRWSWKRTRVVDFHAKLREVWSDEQPELNWVFSNYEFIRSEKNCTIFCEKLVGLKTLLVLDESANLGNRSSHQSKSVTIIRQLCARCVMFNGSDEPPDRYWSQFNILDNVLAKRYKNFITFKWQFAEYEKEGVLRPIRGAHATPGKPRGHLKVVHRQIGWKNFDRLSKILEPYTLRRERKDCPELKNVKVVAGFREVQLSKSSWKMYKQLKRDAMLALDSGEIYLTPNAGVKLLRLEQLCSGHLGGFETGDAVRDLSSEKLEFAVKAIMEGGEKNVIVWCRWVRERKCLALRLRAAGFEVFEIYGNQQKEDRIIAEKIFTEGVERDPLKRYVIVAQPQAGGICLDMAAASTVYRLSADYNLRTYEQSQDRPLGPAQQSEFVSETAILATGPDGERSVEHAIYAALEKKENIGHWTTERWRKELSDD